MCRISSFRRMPTTVRNNLLVCVFDTAVNGLITLIQKKRLTTTRHSGCSAAETRNPEANTVLQDVIRCKVSNISIIVVLNDQNGCLITLPVIGNWIPGLTLFARNDGL